jgi:hypothetical protein
MADANLVGDLRERADGGFDGWCWAPDRPQERLIVELLVNDSVAVSMMAAIFRRDLMTGGYGDGRHGFALRLPPNLPDAQSECLITARERRSGAVFGRVLRGAKGVAPVGGERLERVAGSVAQLWQDLERVGTPRAEPAAANLRAAFGGLAARLAAGPRAIPPFPPLGPGIVLPDVTRPAVSVVLQARRADAALRRIDALADGVRLTGAEVIAIETGEDPRTALLPSRVRNLRYLRDPGAGGTAGAVNLAVAHARGTHLVVLGHCPERPSAGALLTLAHTAVAYPRALLLGATAVAACERVAAPRPAVAARLEGRLGLGFCMARDQWDEIGPLAAALEDGASLECADLACRAALLGVAVLAIAEPAPDPVAVPDSAAAAGRALAAFRDRWGMPIDSLDQGRRPA